MSADKITISKSDLSVIRRLVLENWRKYAPRYALAFVFMFIVSGCTAMSAWLMKDVINDIFVTRDQSALFWLPIVIIAIFTAKGTASYFQEVILNRVGNRMVAQTQKRLFDHLLRLDMTFYHANPSSELITRITHNAQAVRTALNLLATTLGRDLMTLIGLVAVMVIQDPLMFTICLIVAPVGFVVMKDLNGRMRNISKGEVGGQSKIVGAMREAAQGVRVVQAFSLEGAMTRRMNGAIELVERLRNRISAVKAAVNPLVDTLGGVSIAGVVLYAGWRTMSHGETPGEFFSFIAALLMSYEPARRLARLQVELTRAAVGVRLMYEIIDTVPAIASAAHGTDALHITAGEVGLGAVTFSYNAKQPVLKDIDLVAEAGLTTALVGLSGSGKTTITNLILRFWDPTSGRVTIDGQDIRGVELQSLRRSIALVSQDVFLFEGSIRDNIRAGAEGAGDDAIVAAAKAAHAHAFITSLPKGYDTEVGELGTLLSGGQRQRISIARAFLKDAPIILLDEPTSALDSESEQSIQLALSRLTRRKTTLVIAHRLATVINADRIYVIDKGAVAECGTHAELLRMQGLYARLYELQFSDKEKIAV